MKELKIIIVGAAASGKSTMMMMLESLLIEKGFNVELDLELEMLDYGTEERFRRAMSQQVLERYESLLTNTKITLSTKQTHRENWKKD